MHECYGLDWEPLGVDASMGVDEQEGVAREVLESSEGALTLALDRGGVASSVPETNPATPPPPPVDLRRSGRVLGLLLGDEESVSTLFSLLLDTDTVPALKS